MADEESTLLSLLADGEFHSGADLGEQLHISRAAVWKQIKRWRLRGVDIESSHHLGYRVPGGLSLLDAGAILAGVRSDTRRLVTELEMLGSVGSTNDRAMERLKSGAARGYACLAEHQLQGRGRRGRQWASPYGANIYLSVVRQFEGGVAAVEGLSLVVGLMAVEALQRQGVQGLQLKWPNDILVGGRKLGGVLLEVVGDASGRCDVIVGLGINVNMPAAAGASIDQDWVDLRTLQGATVDRNRVAVSVLDQLCPMLSSYESKGFACYRDDWCSHDAYRGKTVALHLGEKTITGVASGVDSGGALQIDTAEGRQCFSGGEISLCRKI